MKREIYTCVASATSMQCDRLLVARLHAYCMYRYLATASSWLELILGWAILVIQYTSMY